MDHDCRLGPLTVQPATMGFEARLQEARRNLIARGRTTHVPYLVALARVIALSHNGNKNGAYGYYPGRDRQVHASSATDSKDSDAKAGDADGGAAAAASTAQVFSPLPTVPERVEVLRKKGADLQVPNLTSALFACNQAAQLTSLLSVLLCFVCHTPLAPPSPSDLRL